MNNELVPYIIRNYYWLVEVYEQGFNAQDFDLIGWERHVGVLDR